MNDDINVKGNPRIVVCQCLPPKDSLSEYLNALELRIQRLEADLKRREDIENAPAKYED